MKGIVFWIFIIFVFFSAVYFYFIQSKVSRNQETAYQDKSDFIKVYQPQPRSVIKSPLLLEGEARGLWFFEASFPIRLIDENGKEIAVAIAQSQGDWMTKDFVSFKAVMEFEPIAVGKGFLVFQKDNPSGLPENDDELRFPVFISSE